MASLEMFKTGLFSSDPTEPCQVDGAGLKKVTVAALAKGMQHSEQNPLAGLEGRAGLLQRLSEALNNQELFGVDARPGNMLGMFFFFDQTETKANLYQITSFLTQLHSHHQSQSCRYPHYGPCLWTD